MDGMPSRLYAGGWACSSSRPPSGYARKKSSRSNCGGVEHARALPEYREELEHATQHGAGRAFQRRTARGRGFNEE